MSGRPLRFLGLVLGGWVAVRVVMLWPAPPAIHLDATRASLAVPQRDDAENDVVLRYPELAALGAVRQEPWLPATGPAPRSAARVSAAPLVMPPPEPRPARPGVDPRRVAVALLALTRFDPAPPALPQELPATPARDPAPRPGAAPWSGSAWLIARGGAGLGAGPQGGQLGGSQAGARIAYHVADRIALIGRVAAPLQGPGSEAALGFEWRVAPQLRVVTEQRIAIDGAGGGPAFGVVGGIGPTALRGFRLEAYGQAGVIGRDRGIYYADGAARIEAPVVRRGKVTMGVGVGAWGAAQTGAERLDLGPTLGLKLPMGSRSARLTLDWRARVAGGAAPGSGPALAIGTDF